MIKSSINLLNNLLVTVADNIGNNKMALIKAEQNGKMAERLDGDNNKCQSKNQDSTSFLVKPTTDATPEYFPIQKETKVAYKNSKKENNNNNNCLLYTSPSPRDATLSRMPSSA